MPSFPRFRPLFPALLALLAGPAFADNQDDPRHSEPKDLDSVIVRASPLAKSAEDLTQPVEVLAGERLDEMKAASLGETVNRLPGIQSSYHGPGVGRPIIRGMDGARVQVLSDGLASGDVSTVSVDHAVTIEPFLANQIEVLKGPATLLYGSGAIGGAVNVIDGRIPETTTFEPLEGRAELRAGSVADERTGMVRLDGTDSSGRLVFHFDALHRETGDYRIPGFAEADDGHGHAHDADAHAGAHGRLPHSFLRTDSAALGASWVGDRGFLGAGYSMFNSRYGVPGHVHPGDDHGHDGHDHDHAHGDGDEHGVHIVMDQRRSEVRGGLDDMDGFESLRVKLAHNEYTHTEFEDNAVGTVFDNDSVEGRVELVHRPLGGWNGAFGLQFSRRKFNAIGAEAFVPDSKSRDTGVFWIGERSFDGVDLELGARYDQGRIDLVQGPSRDFDAASVSAAARWHLGDRLHLSFGIDRAQRTPTAEELYSDGLHVATGSYEFGNAGLDKETANRAELGMHWHHEDLLVSASLYHIEYDDFIYLAETGVVDGGLPARIWNQADARFTGGELDVQWTVLDDDRGQWTVRAFGDAVRARLAGSGTREVSITVPHGSHGHVHSAQIALSGHLPRIAPARVGAEVRWRSADDAWRANLGAVRYGSQDRVAEHESESEGYTLVHAGFAWHLDTAGGKAWELFVDGNNLLDEEARPHTSFISHLAPLPGRNVTAGVRVFF